ncbi:hybrid sensor histidine kinase/response regulator [archaeon]|nr:MAG: hybrid sensor histidine kinase/response regulator [archaeon]
MILQERNQMKRLFAITMASTSIMFSLFIFLCGLTHTFHALEVHFVSWSVFVTLQSWTMIWCAIISGFTALAGLSAFPLLSNLLDLFQLTEEGIVRLADDIDSYKDSFMVLDSKFVVVRGNASSGSLFGPRFVGASFLEFIWDSDDVLKVRTILENLAASDAQNANMSVEFKAYGDVELNEEFYWLESTLQKKAIKASEGVDKAFEIIVTTRNINDRKKVEMYQDMLLTSKAQEQQRINEAKMMYVTCVAHDLKTPLQSFSFAMNLLSQSTLTQDQREIVGNAQVSVDLMKLTVSQAMHFSKVQTGVTVVPRKSTVSIPELLDRIKIIMDNYGAHVPIHYFKSDTLANYIITDEEWLWQMVLNLLTNACKYTTEGCIKVTLQETDNDSMLLCRVSDTGIGIEESKCRTLFNAFSQAQVGQLEGTGLGLYGLRCRVEALGGSCGIGRNLEYDQGSTVWFKIPYVKDAESDQLGVDSSAFAMSPPVSSSRATAKQFFSADENTMSSNSILQFVEHGSQSQEDMSLTTSSFTSAIICRQESSDVETAEARSAGSTTPEPRQLTAIVVDDVLPIRKLMTRVLLSLGFTSVDCYENGLKGLQAMKTKMVDIVFTDIQMPVLSGPEVSSM